MSMKEKELKALTPKGKTYTVSAGNGLYMKVNTTGRKQWLLRKFSCGKAHQVYLGDYPALSMAAAKELAQKAAEKFVDGRKQAAPAITTLSDLAMDWIKVKSTKVRAQTLARLKSDVAILTEKFGTKQLSEISRIEFRQFLDSYADTGRVATAHRLLSAAAAIERHGFALGCVQTPVLNMLRDALPQKDTRHHKAANASQLSELLSLLGTVCTDSETTDHKARLYTLVMLLSLMRSNEVRNLKWDYVDMDAAVITMPAEVMKSGREHRVPVSDQLMSVLLLLKEEATGPYVCSSARPDTPLSAPYFNTVFKRTGIDALSTPHGIRAMARSWFAEQGLDFAAAELCLAHRVENTTQQTYQRSDYLEQRRAIMQAWGDYVALCSDGSIAAILGTEGLPHNVA